jgi:hypothetical protein
MERKTEGQLKPFPLAKAAAALFEITELLAREIVAPTDQRPPWGDFEWRIARAVAAMQGISSLLSAGLRWKGPDSWRRFLEEQRDHVSGRQRRIAKLLDRIDFSARREGIPLMALKGVALHGLGVYEEGERPMADVDLLVRGADTNAITRLLGKCDYDVTFKTWRHHLFESRLTHASNVIALGEHVDNPIKIELHTSIRERLPVSETDITRFIFPIAPQAGLNAYPSMASLMLHLLLHAAGNIRAHALRFIQLHDIAQLAKRFGPSDWEELLKTRPNNQSLWWAAAPLTLTARYFFAVVPAFVIENVNAECPWLLRRRSSRHCLADVSWSNIKIYAFPGIEWARSPREALKFMVSRILPTRESRMELECFNSHHPGAAEIPWYGISQVARALRWAFAKPPRVQTLLTVRAALAECRDESTRGTAKA